MKDARTAAFSPDGRFMAIASQEGAVQIIDASTGKRTREIAAQKAAVRAVSFDESARTLACAHADGSVRLYALPSGALKKKLTESEPSSFGLYALSLSPDGSTVAAGTYWGRILRWDVASGKERPYVSGHGAMVSSVAFSPDGRTLASGSHDATVAWWDASTGAGIVTLRTHTATARAAFSPTANLLAVTGDQMTRIWRFDAETSLDSVSHPCCTVDLLDFAPDGARIALGARTHAGAYTTLVAEAKDAKMIWSTDPERSAITALAFSEKRRMLRRFADRKAGVPLESASGIPLDAHETHQSIGGQP